MPSKTCLILTSNDLPNTPSEAQEVVNLLDRNGYDIHLLQTNVTSLELYRTLQNGPFYLVWVAGHSNEEGFLFGQTVITPTELGQFLQEARAENLILNNCFSAEHVTAIQAISNTNILATIKPTIDDKLAWSSALYLARAIVRTGSIEQAYRETLSGSNSQYRWFPARQDRKGPMQHEESSSLTRMERNVERLSRIMYGDQILKAPGVVDVVNTLQETIKEHVEADDEWKRNTEIRIRVLEASSPGNVIILTRQTVRLVLIFLISSVFLFILIVYLLKG